MFEKQYEIVRNGPPAMPWDDYEKSALATWKELLTAKPDEEPEIHSFLEKHPSFVPGAFSFPQSGHYPFPCALISKPPLSALGQKIPDFLWIATDSGNWYPIFVEIETPSKRWFTNEGIQHGHLTQALTQLAHWKAWISRNENLAVFIEHFRVPDWMFRERAMHPQFVLIHGRRAEFENKPELNRLRDNLRRSDEYLITFDRLEPDRKAEDLICVKKTGERYRAISIPPTLRLGYWHPEIWADIEDKQEAVQANEWLTEERKKFLIERLPYWDELAKSGRLKSGNTGDVE